MVDSIPFGSSKSKVAWSCSNCRDTNSHRHPSRRKQWTIKFHISYNDLENEFNDDFSMNDNQFSTDIELMKSLNFDYVGGPKIQHLLEKPVTQDSIDIGTENDISSAREFIQQSNDFGIVNSTFGTLRDYNKTFDLSNVDELPLNTSSEIDEMTSLEPGNDLVDIEDDIDLIISSTNDLNLKAFYPSDSVNSLNSTVVFAGETFDLKFTENISLSNSSEFSVFHENTDAKFEVVVKSFLSPNAKILLVLLFVFITLQVIIKLKELPNRIRRFCYEFVNGIVSIYLSLYIERRISTAYNNSVYHTSLVFLNHQLKCITYLCGKSHLNTIRLHFLIAKGLYKIGDIKQAECEYGIIIKSLLDSNLCKIELSGTISNSVEENKFNKKLFQDANYLTETPTDTEKIAYTLAVSIFAKALEDLGNISYKQRRFDDAFDNFIAALDKYIDLKLFQHNSGVNKVDINGVYDYLVIQNSIVKNAVSNSDNQYIADSTALISSHSNLQKYDLSKYEEQYRQVLRNKVVNETSDELPITPFKSTISMSNPLYYKSPMVVDINSSNSNNSSKDITNIQDDDLMITPNKKMNFLVSSDVDNLQLQPDENIIIRELELLLSSPLLLADVATPLSVYNSNIYDDDDIYANLGIQSSKTKYSHDRGRKAYNEDFLSPTTTLSASSNDTPVISHNANDHADDTACPSLIGRELPASEDIARLHLYIGSVLICQMNSVLAIKYLELALGICLYLRNNNVDNSISSHEGQLNGHMSTFTRSLCRICLNFSSSLVGELFGINDVWRMDVIDIKDLMNKIVTALKLARKQEYDKFSGSSLNQYKKLTSENNSDFCLKTDSDGSNDDLMSMVDRKDQFIENRSISNDNDLFNFPRKVRFDSKQ